MAVPVLRRYGSGAFAAGLGTTTTIVAAVPANRALVVSKIVVANSAAASVKFNIIVAGATYLVNGMSLPVNQVYTETGLVLVAGDTLVASTDTANGISVTLFGEEVDN